MAVVSGDLVQHDGERIVVDVIENDGEQFAVLRESADLELMHPLAVPVGDLEVIGHLGEFNTPAPEGWREIEHGVWEKA